MSDERQQKLEQAREIQRRMAVSGSGTRRARRPVRLARTILLGTVAVAVSIYWLADTYDVDMDELLGFLGFSALFVGVFVALAVLGGVVLWGIKRVTRKPRP